MQSTQDGPLPPLLPTPRTCLSGLIQACTDFDDKASSNRVDDGLAYHETRVEIANRGIVEWVNLCFDVTCADAGVVAKLAWKMMTTNAL